MIRAMTHNLGYRITAMERLTERAGEPDARDVLFLQEVIPWRLDGLRDVYDLFMAPDGEGTGRHSAVAVRKNAGLDVQPARQVFEILGSYASVVRVGRDRPVILASVHTSPRLYDGEPVDGLVARSVCEPGTWWSDALVLDMAQHRDSAMVVAGDLNEAREWDVKNTGHTCGEDFFTAVEAGGFVDITHRDWKQEHPTRWEPDYQLDRVFASSSMAGLVRTAPEPPTLDDTASDHAPIYFDIDMDQLS